MKDLKNLKIAYVGGGSRNWARTFINDFSKEADLAGTVYLYDIDHEAAENNAVIGNRVTATEGVVGKWKYVAVRDKAEAFSGADFVVMSILPATFDEMASDVHAPEKYGILQTVGDTTGPGGLVRALRTVPIYYDYAKDIEKYCPTAWVINFTNPMTMCVSALYKGFPRIKAFGCCHEVFATQTLLGHCIREMLGHEAQRDDIIINVLGINHFTWITEASYRGLDLFPLYAEFAKKYADGFTPPNKHWMNGGFNTNNKVKFDLFGRFGVIAAAGDRHLAEFCPSNWYLSSRERVAEMGFELTPVSWRKEQQAIGIKWQHDLAAGKGQFRFFESGEETVRQIRALCGLHSFVTNVNIPNVGQMPDLPLGAVVETNARFASDSVRPVFAGKLPCEVNSLVARVSGNMEGTVEAAIAGDYKRAFQIFTADPNVNLSLRDARKLYDEMLENTCAYLPYYDKYVGAAK